MGHTAVAPLLLLGGGGLLASVWPQQWLTPTIRIQGLTRRYGSREATMLSEQSSPLGWLTVVQSPHSLAVCPRHGCTALSSLPPNSGCSSMAMR